MQSSSQAIDIRLLRSLSLPVLFRGSIARRAKCDSIFGLTRFQVTSRTEVNQVDMPIEGAHDVSRFEVAENDRGMTMMEVVEESMVEALFSHGFPYLYGAVNAGGSDGSAVRRPNYGSDVTGMAQVGSNRIASDGVPDVDSFVVTGGSEITAVR